MDENDISQDFGGNFKMTYEIINMSSLPQTDIETYEMNAMFTYSNYPYLSNGGNLKFENIYRISTNITIKGKYQEQEGNVEFLIVKIKGKYYFLHTPNQLMSKFINY